MDMLIIPGAALFVAGAIIAIPALFELTFAHDLSYAEVLAARKREGIGSMAAGIGLALGFLGALSV